MQEFTTADLRTVSQLPITTLNRMIQRGDITLTAGDLEPGRGKRNRRFSWSTAFGVSLAGLLHRQGVNLDVAGKVVRWAESGELHRGILDGKHFLIASRQQVFLARDGAVFGAKDGRNVAVIAIDLLKALQIFNRRLEEEFAATAASN